MSQLENTFKFEYQYITIYS